MTVFEASICLGVTAVLFIIFSPILFGRKSYHRDEELQGRPVTIRMTHRC
ncbi:MAG: hypothetical protein COB61_003980 [Thiotrichales bacterium]|nr:hypothetical protein [Thiotrichales bacterium]